MEEIDPEELQPSVRSIALMADAKRAGLMVIDDSTG
jgi:hypothetical protein